MKSVYWRRVALCYRIMTQVKCWNPEVGGPRVARVVESLAFGIGFVAMMPVIGFLVVLNYLILPLKPLWLARKITDEGEKNIRRMFN